MRLTSEGAARIADEIVLYETEQGEPVLNLTELENCEFDPCDFEGVVSYVGASEVDGMVVLNMNEVDIIIEAMLAAEKQIEDEDTQDALNLAISYLGKLYKQEESKNGL